MKQREVNALTLSKAVGISHVAVGNYLKGQSPKSDHLIAIADFFGVSTDSMLGRSGKYPELQPQVMVLNDAPKKERVQKLLSQIDELSRQLEMLRDDVGELKGKP